MKSSSEKIGLNAILITGTLTLLTASFIWNKNILTTWYSLWTVASSVTLAIMILFLSYDLFLWATKKSTLSTIKDTLTTILIILIGDLLLLQTENFFWKWQSKLTIVIAISITVFLIFYFIVRKYSQTKK